MHYVNQYLGLF